MIGDRCDEILLDMSDVATKNLKVQKIFLRKKKKVRKISLPTNQSAKAKLVEKMQQGCFISFPLLLNQEFHESMALLVELHGRLSLLFVPRSRRG